MSKKAHTSALLRKRGFWIAISVMAVIVGGIIVKNLPMSSGVPTSALSGEIVSIEKSAMVVRTVALSTDKQSYPMGTTWLWRVHFNDQTVFNTISETNEEETGTAKEPASASMLREGLRIIFVSRQNLTAYFDKDVKDITASEITFSL